MFRKKEYIPNEGSKYLQHFGQSFLLEYCQFVHGNPQKKRKTLRNQMHFQITFLGQWSEYKKSNGTRILNSTFFNSSKYLQVLWAV